MTARSIILLKIADRIEANLETLAVAETWDNGKAVRKTHKMMLDHYQQTKNPFINKEFYYPISDVRSNGFGH